MQTIQIENILRILRDIRLYPVWLESNVSDAVSEAFLFNKIDFEKEVNIGTRCRIDFLLPNGVGIELKKGKPNSSKLSRQVERYCACESIKSLIIVVERGVYSFPEEAFGKPVYCVPLNANWGISL